MLIVPIKSSCLSFNSLRQQRPCHPFQNRRHSNYASTRSFSGLSKASLDPYKTLGIDATATEKDIKRAHRKLVKENHPDLHQDPLSRAHVEAKFIKIQEAYEIITGKRRAKDADNSNGWSLHDWYWNFSLKRRYGNSSSSTPPPPPQMMRRQWQEQLSGLKLKAAAKKAKKNYASTNMNFHSHTDDNPASNSASNPTTFVQTSVWRSATTNAKNTSSPLNEVKIHIQQPSLEHIENNINTTTSTTSTTSSTTSVSDNKQEEQDSIHNINDAFHSHKLHNLLQNAVHAVHDMRHRHEHAVHAHAMKMQSHIKSLGHQFSQRLRIDAMERHRNTDAVHDPIHKRSIYYENVVDESVYHAVGAGGGSDTHGKKFADGEFVKTRTSTQLAGLKRRAALKHDIDVL